jgi:hypothetical protein
MLTPRNENLGPEDPGFAAWYRNVLAAAVLIWGAAVEGLDWGQSGVVPELVVNGKRVLLNQMAYAEGQAPADFVRARLGTPAPPPPPASPTPIVYAFFTPFLDADGNWYEWHPWPFGAPLKCRVAAPAVQVWASNADILAEREAMTVYLQGRLSAQVQPKTTADELVAAMIWLANRPK